MCIDLLEDFSSEVTLSIKSIPDVFEFGLFKVREYFFKFKAKNAGISIDMASIFNDEINKIDSSLKPKLECVWYNKDIYKY